MTDGVRAATSTDWVAMRRSRRVAVAMTVSPCVHETATRDAELLEQGKSDLDTMTDQVHRLEAMLNSRAGRAAELSDRLGRSTADAVRSLQFEDIVRQVAEHAEVRVDQLNEFLDALAGHLCTADVADLAEAKAQIAAAAEQLTAEAPNRAAAQESLGTGSIDLF